MRLRRGSVRAGLVAAVVVATWTGGRKDHALAAGPARKDSLPRFRPNGAALEPWVTPKEARPGESVTYVITAKLLPGCRIHPYRDAAAAAGVDVASTRFDFFDTGGLKPEGDWAALEPTRFEILAMANRPLELHDGEVNWIITLKVPPGMKPGKTTLRCQASYQVVERLKVSLPGRWTLPEVVLTIKE